LKFKRIKNIYVNDGSFEWRKTHAQAPFPYRLDNGLCRLFFTTRDSHNCAHPTYLDFDMDRMEVVQEPPGPLLVPGNPGCHDDAGVMSGCVVKDNDRYLLYYLGWSLQVAVPHQTSIGVAVSKNMMDWTRYSEGPILSRSIYDPLSVYMPFVTKVANDWWRMWYVSGDPWRNVNGAVECAYTKLKYAESNDGIHWNCRPEPILVFQDLIARPSVRYVNGDFELMLSVRGIDGFRTNKEAAYRPVLFRSQNGITNWKSENVDMAPSENEWDSIMTAYGILYSHHAKNYLFYNGNGFGKTGIGIAVET